MVFILREQAICLVNACCQEKYRFIFCNFFFVDLQFIFIMHPCFLCHTEPGIPILSLYEKSFFS